MRFYALFVAFRVFWMVDTLLGASGWIDGWVMRKNDR